MSVLYVCSWWVKAFPVHHGIAPSVAKILMETVIPTWGTLSALRSDRGTHFTGQIVQQVCGIWPLLQHFHPISSVGRMKLKMPSSKTSSVVLLHMRSTLENKLSLFEVTAERPIHLSPMTLDSLVIKGGNPYFAKGLLKLLVKLTFE